MNSSLKNYLFFIEEEKVRRKLTLERSGELFFFYKADYIVVTEELSKVSLTADEFTGIPSLLRQLNEDEMETVWAAAERTSDSSKV